MLVHNCHAIPEFLVTATLQERPVGETCARKNYCQWPALSFTMVLT